MDLLEYQANELFREMGIPVLSSQRIDHPRDLRSLQIPYPIVLKSQVRAGGRGRAGGIRFTENTIDAIAAARTIFNLPILGEYPQVLLAEAKYNVSSEFYLAVVLDYAQGRPVLLGSSRGGMNLEDVKQYMQKVVVDQEFSPFYARHLAVKMGLRGQMIQLVSSVLEKMYQLFFQKDLDLVEINPLGVSPSGEVMALDGRVTINDDALGRHPQLISKWGQIPKPYFPRSTAELEGNIGILCKGAGLALATVDLVHKAGGIPRLCLLVETEKPLEDHLQRSLEQMIQNKNIKVVLVNILSNEAEEVAEVTRVIAAYLQRKVLFPKFVIRLFEGEIATDPDKSLGQNPESSLSQDLQVPDLVSSDTTQNPLANLAVHLVSNLDDAVAKAVALAK
jgi:succinyl-CoA synthetase beta subunit